MLGAILIFVNVFLRCKGSSVYLAGNHGGNYGRVEIYRNNMRGTVCDNTWDNYDARVVCRQLGLPTSYATALGLAALGSGSGPIWFDEVNCTGSESNIASCASFDLGVHNCVHTEDAAVLCQGTFLSIFLGGIHGTNFGRVQVVAGTNTSIGTVCDDEWDENDAAVVCRQLGHPTSNVQPLTRAHFGIGTGPIWLDNVNCLGTETSLTSCSTDILGTHDCSHWEDAGVICGYNLQVRLRNMAVNGNYNIKDGVIQIHFRDYWVNVKNGTLALNELKVLCRQLGFKTAASRKVYIVQNEDVPFKNAQMVTYVKCDGNETNIGHCQFTVTDSGVTYDSSNFNDANTAAYLVCEQTGIGQLKNLNSSTTGGQIIVPSNIPTDLVCVAGPSIPRQTITWNLTPDFHVTETYQMSKTGRYTTKSRVTFIPDVVKHNGSTVSCHLQPTYGTVRSVSESVRIIVRVAVTTVSIHTSRQNVSFGDTITLFCTTSFSDPAPNVQWFIDNNQSVPSSGGTVFTDKQTNLSQTVSELNFSLNDTSSASVSFHCEASNIPSVHSVKSSVAVVLITSSAISVETTTIANTTTETSTVRRSSIFAYLTICLGAVVFICAIIIVVLVLRIKKIQAENPRQNRDTHIFARNPSQNSYVDNRVRLPAPPSDKTFEEESNENPGMSTENLPGDEELYEVLQFSDEDGQNGRSKSCEDEDYLNSAI